MTVRRRDAPPRLATWLVLHVVPAAARDAVLGDLDERFRSRIDLRGPRAARRWYWRQALAFVLRGPGVRAAGRAVTPDRTGRAAFAGIAADVRLAGRTLRRRPGLTATAILVLSLAVGANTTVFSVVEAILIRPLPYPSPDRLVMLWDAYENQSDDSPLSREHVQLWSARTDLFTAVGAYESFDARLRIGDWPEVVDAALVTPGLLPMLGARPHLGRLLAPEDEAPGAEPVVVLSYDLWASSYGRDEALIGRHIIIGGFPTRVIGVTTPDFWFYDPYSAVRSYTARHAEAARLWTPLRASAYGGEMQYPRYRAIARLRDGISLDAAREAAAAFRREMPPTEVDSPAETRLVPLTEQVVGEVRPRLLGLAGAVALVLLIAGVNLVSLLLVQLDARRAELAVRAALGAGRGRLTRQLVIESTLLGLAGGAGGLGLSVLGTSWLVSAVPRGLPLAHRVELDAGVAAFGVGLAVLSGLLVGLVAALRLDPRRLAASMASGQRTMAGTRASRRLHGMLVGAEVALSLVLLIAATLLLRSLAGVRTTDAGFVSRDVLTFQVVLAGVPDGEPNYEFFVELEDRLRAMAAVSGAGATTALPFSRWSQSAAVVIEGATSDEPIRVAQRFVSPGYFEAIGLPVRIGRGVETTDRIGTPAIAVVNEAFVTRLLDGASSPIGRRMEVVRGRNRALVTIAGVVKDVKHSELYEAARPVVYVPVRQQPMPFLRFAVRGAAGDPMQLVEPVRRAASEIDPDQVLQEFVAFDTLVNQSIEDETFYTQVLGLFAASALILALVGIYGAVSYTTRQRDREVGIRLALGATSGGVRHLLLGQGLVPVWCGLAVGWLGAWWTTRLLGGLLHGVSERDLVSFAGATLAFALVAAAACLMPARRAARLDPVQVLRGE